MADEDRHGPWSKVDERYEDGCREDRPHAQPAPEADEREALARRIFDVHFAEDGRPLFDQVREWWLPYADAALDWFASRSQPAPRTVSAEEIRFARRIADGRMYRPGATVHSWGDDFLLALGITVEAPRG